MPQPGRVLHQWKTFRRLGEQIITAADPVAEVEALLSAAETNLNTLQEAGVVIDRASVSHHLIWKQAIESFRNGVL